VSPGTYRNIVTLERAHESAEVTRIGCHVGVDEGDHVSPCPDHSCPNGRALSAIARKRHDRVLGPCGQLAASHGGRIVRASVIDHEYLGIIGRKSVEQLRQASLQPMSFVERRHDDAKPCFHEIPPPPLFVDYTR
jgi:hypothetical protein